MRKSKPPKELRLHVIEWFESGEWQPVLNDVFLYRANAIERRDTLRRLDKMYPVSARRLRLATYERVAPTRKTVKGRKAKQLATKLADPFDGSWKVGSLAPHSMKGKPSAK